MAWARVLRQVFWRKLNWIVLVSKKFCQKIICIDVYYVGLPHTGPRAKFPDFEKLILFIKNELLMTIAPTEVDEELFNSPA